MPARKRTRRTPVQARLAILDAARHRLLEHGIDGLKVADVARDAGMSHATVLHHFGSTEEMRAALVTRMSEELLSEFVAASADAVPAADTRAALLERVFSTLADARHGQLFAWMSLQHASHAGAREDATHDTRRLLRTLLAQLERNLGGDDARFLMTLVIGASIGIGVSRPWLEEVGLMRNRADLARFTERLSALVESVALRRG